MDNQIFSRLKKAEKQTQKVYGNLCYKDRLRLHVKAKSIGNEAEIKKLQDTCPRHIYQMFDARTENHKRAFEVMFFLNCMDLAHLRRNVDIIDGTIESLKSYDNYLNPFLFKAYIAGWKHGAKKEEIDYTELEGVSFEEIDKTNFLEDQIRIYKEAKIGELKKAKTKWRAYCDICLELFEIDEKEVLSFGETEWLRDFIEDLSSEEIQLDQEQYNSEIQTMHCVYVREVGESGFFE